MTSSVVRCVRTLSEVHRTAIALWRRDMTVRQFLETKVFSPDNFPSLLTLGISLSFLEFCGVMGWRYWQRQAATAGVATSTTTVAKKITMNATTAAATTRRRVPPHVAYKYMGE